MRRFSLVAMLVCAGTAFAEAPVPPKELDGLGFMAGAWKCNGQETAAGTSFSYKSTLKLKLPKGGFWYDLAYARPKDNFNPAFTGKGTVGWDSAAKQYVFLMFDNWGGHFEMRAPAGDGKKLVFVGDASVIGQKIPMRYTFEGAGDAKKPELDTTAEANQGGSWKPMDVEVCKR